MYHNSVEVPASIQSSARLASQIERSATCGLRLRFMPVWRLDLGNTSGDRAGAGVSHRKTI